jgi:hypothetical protein
MSHAFFTFVSINDYCFDKMFSEIKNLFSSESSIEELTVENPFTGLVIRKLVFNNKYAVNISFEKIRK